MKPKLLLVVIFASALQSLSAQFPGGVESPQVWAHDTLSMQMRSALGFTYIGVSKVVDEKEHALWVLGNEHNTALIQTTARSADLTRGTFLNYAPEGFPELRLYSYTTSSRLDGMQHLHVGQAKTQKLPVKDIGKGIVEYAVYNRRLSELIYLLNTKSMISTSFFGHLTQDAKVAGAEGAQFISFTVAVNDGEDAYFLDCAYWSTSLLPYLKKGSAVFVLGKLRARPFVDGKGSPRPGLRCNVLAVRLAGASPKDSSEPLTL